jgi:hypothetical protein
LAAAGDAIGEAKMAIEAVGFSEQSAGLEIQVVILPRPSLLALDRQCQQFLRGLWKSKLPGIAKNI